MSYVVTVGTCVTFAIISWNVDHVDAGGCPANGFPIVEMCKGGSASSGTILMDFFGASSYPAPVCKCEALIIKGRSFQFSQVAAPGYQGCGTEIHIQKNVGGDQGGSILKCYGGTSLDVRPGDSLTITLYKHTPPTDTRYCYRIDITGNNHAAVSLTCTKAPTPSPLPTTTTVRDTGQGQTLTSETSSSVKTKTTTDPIGNDTNKGFQDAFVKHVPCNNTNYFTAVVLLTVCLGLLSIYAIVATYKLLQRRNHPNTDEPSTSTDIYEEIPAKMYISATPVYRDSFNSNTSSIPSPRFKDPLPDLPPTQAPCRSCSNVSLIPIQENTSSVWNWTYNNDKNTADIISGVKDTQAEHLHDNYDVPSLDIKQEYEFPNFEYENARF